MTETLPQPLFLLIGLGNRGRKYRNNRHNVGFMILDRLASRLGLSFDRLELKALVAKGQAFGSRLILAKPQTYMNESGIVVRALVRFYKVPMSNLLVAYDDVDLPFGTLRLRPSGGSAGQKGIKSIIDQLGDQSFPRLRFGIGRPPAHMEAAEYVLQDFNKAEAEQLSPLLDRAVDAILSFVENGIDRAMNLYNSPAVNAVNKEMK